ncbi:MAG: MBL fold metallo-hydrolase [Defluviitaleaceae bacterium]|nr:MBL fold metallo-hydrolase [Defluviitaleaceae bacterium]
MSITNKIEKAKQVKNTARAVKSTVREVKNSRGGGGGRGGKKKNKKGFPKALIALIIIAAIGLGVAWYFGVFDSFIEAGFPQQEAREENNIQPPAVAVGGEIRVHFIDVGQADAILIQSADNAVLIDAGARNAERIILPYLESVGVTALDVLVGTHPHADHIGGAAGILDAMEVREVWMPNVTHTTRTFERFIDAIAANGAEVHLAHAGDILSAGQIQMTVVHPNRTGYSSLNDYSVVLHMQFGETAFIFTGDGEGPTDREILENGWYIRSNVMLAGHHGSRTSSSEALIDAINPDIAVISVGAGNKYGHPHQVVLDRFAERNIEVLRTDLEGTIVLVTDGANVRRETT